MAPSLSTNQCHVYAQKLNNSAALCIEIGHYDRAIFSLTKALRLSKEQSDESMACGCKCRQCSLDGCIAFSESTPPMAIASTPIIGKDMKCGYVYQRPLRIPPLPILENHNMGRTLFLIVTFNLAMAHHLSVMANSTGLATESGEQTAKLQTNGNKIKKALQLYELCNNWHRRITARESSDESDASLSSGFSSIRFRMILTNNLSHIHRLGSNYTKQRQCLEHLLSTVMLAVDYKTRTCSTTITGDDTAETTHSGDLRSTDLDGFLMNASRLFLQDHCAEAA